jgi:hypothetical protein
VKRTTARDDHRQRRFYKKRRVAHKGGTEISLPVHETLHNFSKAGFIEEPFQVLIPESK